MPRSRLIHSSRSKIAGVADGSSPCICDQSSTWVGPAADRQVQQVAAFDGAADDLARHPPRVGVDGARRGRDHVVVRHERGRRQRDVMRVPPRGERSGAGRAGAAVRGRPARVAAGAVGRMPRAPGQGRHAGDQNDAENRRPHDDGCPYFSRTIEARWPGCGASTNTLS